MLFSVALAYYLGGQVGLLFAIPPSGAGVLWPSAGIALITVMFLGWPAAVGVFIGAFVTVFQISPEDVALIVSSVNGLGSVLQAVVGGWLIRKIVGMSDRFVSERSIFMLLLLGAPLACLVSATINLTAQCMIGLLDSDEFLSGWLFWWLGDTIGVLVFAPLTLLLVGRSHHDWHQKRFFVAVPIMLCFLLTAAVFGNSMEGERKRLETEFQRQSDSLAYALQIELKNHEAMLSATGGFYDASSFVNRTEFQQFARRIGSGHEDLIALEWVPLIKSERREVFENRGEADFGPSFQISEWTEKQDVIVIAAERKEYLPILYIEPMAENEKAVGYDILSNPVAKEAVIRARDSGNLATTAPIRLVQGDSYSLNNVMYLPVYRKDSDVGSVASRREAFKGVLASVIDFNALVFEAFNGIGSEDVGVRIFRDNDGKTAVSSFFEKSEASQVSPFGFLRRFDLVMGDISLQMEVFAQKAFVSKRYSRAIWPLFLGGLLFSALATMFILMMALRSVRVGQLVEQRTRKLNLEIKERQRAEKAARLNEERFYLALQATNEGIWDWNIQTGETTTIPSWEKMLGYDKDELAGKDVNIWSQLIHPDDKVKADQIKKEFVEGLRPNMEREFRMKHKNGYWAWILSKGEAMRRDKEGLPLQVVGTRIDITERKKAREAMRIAAISFDTHEAIMVTNSEGIIIRVNKAFCEITGYSEKEAVGENPRILKSGKHGDDFYRDFWRLLEKENRWEGEIWNRRKNGEVFPVHTRVTNVLSEQGVVTHRVAIFSDVAQRKQDEAEINKLAFYDPLTNLPNRRLLMVTLEYEMMQARRNDKWGGLIFLDLDHFKTINDSLGHGVGDLLLMQVAIRLNEVVREADLSARLGGDEFVVLLSAMAIDEAAAANQALVVAEKIQSVINQPYSLDGIEYHISSSIGIRLYPVADDQPESLIRNADTAMYKAKEEGRNTIRFYNREMQEHADEWLSLKTDLHRAIKNKEFELYFQCQNNREGEIVGAEVLLRWQHPEKGMISPVKFIPVAEQTGQIIQIGEQVIRKACELLRQWQDERVSLPHLAVNVSPQQFKQPGFVDLVSNSLKESGAKPSQLMLELTEGVVVDNVEETIEKMHALKELGISFSIDDFGTGYSSLSYLKKLPLDQLKIDRTFVRDIASDPDDAIIVETIIAMAKHLQFDVIAEGVETREQLDFLTARGCYHYQGYYFAQPEPVDCFVERLRNASLKRENRVVL